MICKQRNRAGKSERERVYKRTRERERIGQTDKQTNRRKREERK